MPTLLVVLSLVLATVVLGAVAGGGTGLAAVLFVVAVAAGFALNRAAEDPFAAASR
ncbi:MAG: hypothetical protein K2Y71_19910 [Xanthobacteraceae bacterium]|nr:hypothetical protein [Xanthobacteraceae bacterium]